MSEIRATTISDTAGTGPITLTKQSAAKAYIAYNATSGALDSFNISSTTDENGTNVGQYTHNLTNAMSQNNYYVAVSSTFTASDRFATSSAVLTTSYTTFIWDATTPSRFDGSRSSAIFGDLA